MRRTGGGEVGVEEGSFFPSPSYELSQLEGWEKRAM